MSLLKFVFIKIFAYKHFLDTTYIAKFKTLKRIRGLCAAMKLTFLHDDDPFEKKEEGVLFCIGRSTSIKSCPLNTFWTIGSKVVKLGTEDAPRI